MLAIALATVALPSPFNPLSPTPPLGSQPPLDNEGVIHRVETDERVRVRVDPRGRPFDVRARQRLVVLDKGDYVFVVPAPVVDVLPAPGSESSPGQRRTSILWSGFNPRRKVLAADARLRAREAAPALPIRVETSGDTITVENATAVDAATFTAGAAARPLARYLDLVRTAVSRERLVPIGTADISTAAKPATQSIEAPLRVRGTVGGRRVDTVLGDGRPLRLTVPRGNGKVDLAVDPVPPTGLLTPPDGARSWAAAGTDGRRLLERAQAVLLRIARTRQYDAYLAAPGPRGTAQTTYEFRSGIPRAAPPAAQAEPPGEDDGLRNGLLVAAVALVAAGGAVAVWARS